MQLGVATATTTGLRGDPLTVAGTITDAQGNPLVGRPVELLLKKKGSKDMIVLGETVSGAGGRYRLKTTIPEDKRKNYGSFKPTDEVFEAFEATAQFCRGLGVEKIIFQCPPRFRMTSHHVSNIMGFFGHVEGEDFTFIWEPRGNWDEEEIRAICNELGLVHCIDPFRAVPVSGGVRYFRLHGLKGYRYQYTDEDLRELKAKWSFGEAVYFMFNNISMMEDAHRFEELLRSGS